MNISKHTLSNPVLVIIVFALLGIMGLFSFDQLEANLYPELNWPELMITATYENAGPQSVESAVTKVIEDGLISVSNLKKLTSVSSDGLCSIYMEFTYGTNLDVATNEVRDALDSVRDLLPKSVKSPSIMKFTNNTEPIMKIAVRGSRSSEELRYIADNEIKNILTQAGGVGRASVNGGRRQIVRVELSQNRLEAFGLTVPEVSEKLALENLDLGGGKIREGYRNFVVRTTGEYTSIKEINDTVLATVNGYNVKLSDVGTAFMGYNDKTESVYINGMPGIYVSITKQSGTNTVKVADAVYEKLEELKHTLPTDIFLEVISDDSTMIRDTLHTLFDTAWQGILLAVIMLFLFLRSIKSTFIISISIPLSIVITALLMHLSGISLNLMTLAGLILGVGMVVDASVVMIDNIYNYRIRGTRAKTAAILGSQEMISSVVSGNLTTIVVFLPFLLYLNELEWVGPIVKDLIFTIAIAIISSLFVAIFLVPVLAGHYLPLSESKEPPIRTHTFRAIYRLLERWQDHIADTYRFLLKGALNHRILSIIGSVIILIGALALVPNLGIDLMPDIDNEAVTLDVELPVGSSLEATENVLRYFEQVVYNEIKGYKTVVISAGTDPLGEVAGEYKGSLSIYLPPYAEQIDTSSVIQKKLTAHFDKFIGTKLTFGLSEIDELAGNDIDIAIRSQDFAAAAEISHKLTDIMEGLGCLSNISSNLKEGLPQVEVCIDRQRAAEFGVSVVSAATEVNNSIAGVTATKFRTNGNEYDIVLMYRDSDRQKVLNLDSIMVEGKDGLVSLSNFAEIKKSYGPAEINRQNRTRTIHITANIDEKAGDTSAPQVEAKIKKKMSENVIVPPQVTVSYEGSWQTMQKQGMAFLQIIILAMILVFGVMAGTYGSFTAPFINMMTIPFMFIGVIVAYILNGQQVSIMTMIGLIMLVGIVVNNGIILVDYTNLLVNRGLPIKEACLEAGISRLRPVLMTTLSTVLGMLPMSFTTSGSAAIVQPIGLGVLGGLISSTFVTLILIPVLYSLMMKPRRETVSTIEVIDDKNVSSALNMYNNVKAGYRCEIIANQSVQADITELLEQHIDGIQYSVIEQTFGRGKRSRKLGSSVWPEMNFILTTYIDEATLPAVQNVISAIQAKFPNEGIQLFAAKV
ncbi:MAG: efflux RND transporter permease subunit [Spirochaetales bacterium]|nr:efflux RND transporter permease subunit [Spirochaetales bacterium]